MAKQFLTAWFTESDLISLVGKNDGKFTTYFAQVGDLLKNTDEEWRELYQIEWASDGLYFGVHPVKQALDNPRKRGTAQNIKALNGVYADLDIKPGAFEDQTEILHFINRLPLKPTALIDSGSGGAHAYWKFDSPASVTKDIQRAWNDYLRAEALKRGKNIDQLKDITRILRVPGSPRGLRTVSIISLNPENTYPLSVIEEQANPAHYQASLQRRATKKRFTQAIEECKAQYPLQALAALVELEERYTETDWAEILEPQGWRLTAENQDGSRQWARPGATSPRSAVTDWLDPATGKTSGAMSLLSDSPETRLADLKDADIALTKYRVAMRLIHNDDFNSALNAPAN